MFSSTWSPDGQEIAFEAVGMKGQSDIFVGDWAGVKWTNLTNSPYFDGDPDWSPDGRTIAYTGKNGDPDNSIFAFSITPDGINKQQLLTALTFPSITRLSWSPDGNKVVFMVSDNQGYYQLYTANLDGSDLKQLTYLPENHLDPRFSQDGQWIVYTKQANIDSIVSNLYKIRPDGTGEIAITEERKGWRSESRWSPTGNWIAFTSDVDGNYDLFLIRQDGADLVKVTHNGSDVLGPAWRRFLQ
jgi:TolB protein